MPEAADRPLLNPRRLRLGRWRRLLRYWPFLAWVSLSALCLLLYIRSTQFGIITASGQSIHHDVAPLQVARVKEVYVQLGSHVTNGQVVAQMDTLLVDTQVAEAEATLATAQTSMAAYQGQMLALIRTAEDEILISERALGLKKTEQESDTARLAELKSIQAERDKLFKANLIPEQLADALRPEMVALEKQVAAYPAQISAQQRLLDDQRKHRADLQNTLHLEPEEDILKAISEKAAAEARILGTVVERRKLEKETYALRAQADGVVSDIHLYPGVVAKAGESVVSIVSPSDLIIGYLPEFRLGRLNPGDHGFAFRLGHPAVKVEVVEIVPEVNPIPVQLSPISAPLGATFRSQKVVFKTEDASDIMPGEKVEVRMASRWWAQAKHSLVSLRR
jgi:HlyD family secretion protein